MVLLAQVHLARAQTAAVTPTKDAPPARVSERIRGREIAGQMRALDDPEHRRGPSATHMRDDDTVLGVVASGQARAYPWWILKNYHVVNDRIGETPVVVSLCEQCSGGAAFRGEHAGRVLHMDTPGVYNGTIILQDRETGTFWAPFSGRALEGPLAGQRLDRLPLLITHWDDWLTRHPETDVIWARPSLRSGHGSWYAPGKWGIVSEMGATLETWDSRLPENTLVYGVEDGNGKAYPLTTVEAHQGVVNDEVGKTPVVVVARGGLEVVGFERRLGSRLLTFRPSPLPEAVMVDSDTGSLWSLEGEAIRGPLRGARLKALDGYGVEWHVWFAYHPETEIYGGTGPEHRQGLAAGILFPELTLPTLATGSRQKIDFKGEVNLVALWAAWCPPCRKELHLIQGLVDQHAVPGLTAVGIAMHIPEEIERETVQSFVAETRITLPIFLVDDPGYDQLESLARSAGGPGLVLPTVFVVDKGGRVLSVFSGAEVDDLPDALKKLDTSESLEPSLVRPAPPLLR
jgi:thiol-disulfide isomerase/thioredoxin